MKKRSRQVRDASLGGKKTRVGNRSSHPHLQVHGSHLQGWNAWRSNSNRLGRKTRRDESNVKLRKIMDKRTWGEMNQGKTQVDG